MARTFRTDEGRDSQCRVVGNRLGGCSLVSAGLFHICRISLYGTP